MAHDTLAELHEPQRRRAGWSRAIGLGWWIDRDDARGRIVSHGGEVDGHSSHLAFSPDHRVGIVVLANLGGGTAFSLDDWLMTEALRSARASGVPTLRRANDAYANADWGEAAWAYASFASVKPEVARFHYRHGVASHRLHRETEAIDALNRALDAGLSRQTIDADPALSSLARRLRR